MPNGVINGAGRVRFLGVSGRTRCYETDLSGEELMNRVEECMRNIGRGVRLRQQPDAAACLIRYVLTRPALLVFRRVKDLGVLSVWTGRGAMSWASRMRAIRAFERPLSEVLRLSEKAPPEEEPEKKRRRKRKKASREEAPEDVRYAEEYGEEYGEEYDEEYGDGYGEEYDGADEHGETAKEDGEE
jgi:hypothetical protein